MHSQEQFPSKKSFERLPSVFKCKPPPSDASPGPCAVCQCPRNTGASTEHPLDPTHSSSSTRQGHSTAPQGHPTRGNRVAFTSLGESLLQTNKFKGSQRMHSPHLNLQLVQHSTVLCLGQSFSKFQSGFVSKSTFHYQHQVHFSGLACFTTIYTVRAISGSNQFLKNPAKQLACSLPQEQPPRLLEAWSTRNQPACHHVPMHPALQGITKQANNQRLRAARHH